MSYVPHKNANISTSLGLAVMLSLLLMSYEGFSSREKLFSLQLKGYFKFVKDEIVNLVLFPLCFRGRLG